jgi:hypothetical protein
MTIKIVLYTAMFFLLTSISFGQCEKTDSTILLDADSMRLGILYKTNDKIDSTLYWDLGKNMIDVSFEVPEYIYGIDSLNSFLLTEFRNKLNFVEVNGAALVYILLDGSDIKEIRIGKRIGYHKQYDDLIKETLMLTQGNWIVPDKSKSILFTYLFKMK